MHGIVFFAPIQLINQVGSNNWLYHITTAHPGMWSG